MKSELGSVDPDAVKRAFHELDDKFMRLPEAGARSRRGARGQPASSSSASARTARAKWTYLEESDLGDRDTEKCLLDAVMGAHWPKPDGGDAEARYSMELPPQRHGPATDWSSDKVRRGARQARATPSTSARAGASGFQGDPLRRARGQGPRGRRGHGASKDGDGKADCVAKVLGKMKGLPSPGSWPAKVSFGL